MVNNMNFSKIECKKMNAPYTCDGRGAIRIIVYRTKEQMLLDNVEKEASRNLVWWSYDQPTPKYSMSSVDEKLPTHIIYQCFESTFGVTKENHLQYAKDTGMIVTIMPNEVISDIVEKPIISNNFVGR